VVEGMVVDDGVLFSASVTVAPCDDAVFVLNRVSCDVPSSRLVELCRMLLLLLSGCRSINLCVFCHKQEAPVSKVFQR
jgi:hypothetical protein